MMQRQHIEAIVFKRCMPSFVYLIKKVATHLVFQPEVLEDLSIQDEKGDLLEVIQVKSGRHLDLSSFKESFFRRIHPLIKSQNPPQIIIVSYGEGRT